MPADLDEQQPPSPATRRLELGLLLTAVAATLLWIPLYHWYSIRGHWEIEHYAFDKLRGIDGAPVLSNPLRWTAVLFIALTLVYVVGWVLLARLNRLGWTGRVAIVLAGLGPGIANIGLFPVGALDVFRYMVALRQFVHFGENPYITGFAAHEGDPFTQHGFLLSLPNAKGPAWLLLSSPAAWLAGIDDPIRVLVALKIFNLAAIALTAYLISRFFTSSGQRWLAAYAFWANPLVLFEGVGVVHNDVLIALFTVGALLAFRRGSWLTFPLLCVSALVKYFTLQLGPLLLIAMIGKGWPKRRIALSIVAALGVAFICIAPFWADGEMVTGVDSVGDAYNRSSHLSIISLARQYRIQGQTQAESRDVSAHQPWFAAAYAAVALPFYWHARRGRGVERRALELTLIFLLLLTLMYPWYLITVFALIALRRQALDYAYLFVATLGGMVYYPVFVWATHASGYPRFEKHLFLASFLTLPVLAYFVLRLWQGAASRWTIRMAES